MDTLLPLDRQSLPASLDAQALLREARAQVEALASERWTDYNTHDPGITILEQLVYALTDLGLRSRLDIADYLAGGEEHQFFTAKEILPNAACTHTDFRRLLIARPGIRNAWLEEQIPANAKGLYTLLVDLEPEDTDPDSLNRDELDLNINWLKGKANELDFYVVFPSWEDISSRWAGETDLSGVSVQELAKLEDPGKTVLDQYLIKMTFAFGEKEENLDLWVQLPKGIPKSHSQTESDFRDKLRETLHGKPGFFTPHQQRARLRKQKLEEAAQFIRQHRNLGEDWGEIDTIRVQQIGIRLQGLELIPEADPEAVLARIWFLLEQFIDPRPQFVRFDTLRAQNLPAVEIFDGPLLGDRFLPGDQLRPEARSHAIYTSDLVRIVMEQPEVIGIRRLTLDHFIERIRVATGVDNCLNLRNARLYKPKFSFDDSSATVIKRGVAIQVDDWTKVRDQWQDSKGAYGAELPATADPDLPVPAGERLDIAAYYSVQNEFPQAYGLRAGEIPDSAPAPRHAQAKQLKGYLCLFDQLMANHTAQLANLGNLFSSDDIRQTYFHQPLYQTPAVQEVLDAYLDKGPAGLSWADFKIKENAYEQGLAAATESPEQFRLRRNRFLDHLLARLGEDFSEYSAWAIARNGGTVPDDLLAVKRNFLEQVPELSRNRSVAFDYMATDVWDTDNVSGYEKRVAALLGIVDCRRRTLSSDDTEGMHLIEHVLIKRVMGLFTILATPNFNTGDTDPLIPDPYSFQISIFLPGWTPRFRDPEFRALAERILRRELPAHLYAWIYWVEEKGRESGSKFRAFEDKYKFWLDNLHTAQWHTGLSRIIKSINELIASDEVTRTNQYALFDIPDPA